MAFLPLTRYRVEDAAGAPVSGGKVRVYNANTTTLSTLYATAALDPGSLLANPVVADSAGWAAQIFLADGNYDVAILSAADVVLKTQDDVPAVGSDAATLDKDFTNSRFKVSGTAGVVNIEVGDPSPDNTGGSFRIGGWADTQADDGEIDAATLNVTGQLTESDGKKLDGVVYTPATTFTAVSAVDIPLTESPANVRAFEVDVFDLASSAGTVIYAIRFSYDGGSNYKTGASDYAYANAPYYDQAAGTLGGISHDDAHTHIILNGASSAQLTDKPFWLTLRILTPETGNAATAVKSELLAYDQPGTWPVLHRAAGYGLGAYGRATHVRLFATTGGVTLTGKYRVRPLRGFGD